MVQKKDKKKVVKSSKPVRDMAPSFLGRIKGMRGMFYRKTVDFMENVSEEEPDIKLPSFSIGKTEHIVDFPDVKDPTKVNVTYPLIEPFAYANIKWNSELKELDYTVIEPELNDYEKKKLKEIINALVELVEVGLTSMRKTNEAIPYLQGLIGKVVRNLGMKLTEAQYTRMMYYIYRDFVGFNEIEPFLQDPNIEDISCDGTDTPIFIIHRKFGSVRTNVSFGTIEELREFVVKLSERTGRYVSYAEPILDGTLPDGSRVAATLAGDVATRGPTFTIRKFSEKPFSPIDQIGMGTVDENILAYFWYLIEHGASMLVVGGVATGKTSFLNTISMFIPPEAKVVSIEDTREIRIPHEHWIAGLARSGFGIPSPSGKKYGEVTLFDLLRESFRQNPDYVIVGEVRGKETYVMFQGMSSGHPSFSTFHAGSVESVIKRLTTPPINLSPSLIESLDVITVMIHAREKGKSARRIKEIAEIVSIDSRTQEVKTNVVFRWNPVNDGYEKVGDSIKLEKMAVSRGSTVEDALADVEDRRKVVQWLNKTGKKDYIEVAKYIDMYLKEKDRLFKLIGEVPGAPAKTIPIISTKVAPAPVRRPVPIIRRPPALVRAKAADTEVQKRPKRNRTSILELLGNMKVLREK